MDVCRRISLVALAGTVALLVGCGGGGIEGWIAPFDADDLFDWHYGSIALNPETFAGSITANQPSQETSDTKAIEVCGGGACKIVLRYAGMGTCGAIARAANWKYGVSTGASREDAMAKALDACRGQGGLNCDPGLTDCNG